MSGEGSSRRPSRKHSAISKQVLKSHRQPQTIQPMSSKSTPTKNSASALTENLRGKPTQPLRSTKISQKLVLFPQSTTDDVETQATLPIDIVGSLPPPDSHLRRPSTTTLEQRQEEHWQDEQGQSRAAGVPLPIEWTFGSRTPAERMTKEQRELALLPRAAAYCTGEGYDLERLRPFLRQHHRVAPRLYDECLYATYHFPLRTLRPDKENLYNIRVRSSPAPKHPSKVHDGREIQMNTVETMEQDEEEMNYEEDHYRAERPEVTQSRPGEPFSEFYSNDNEMVPVTPGEASEPFQNTESNGNAYQEDQKEDNIPDFQENNRDEQEQQPDQMMGKRQEIREPFKGGEVFIFDYGVVVFWNFRRAEELLMLEDLAQFSIGPFKDNPDEDMQIEEIHFQYDTSQMKPRIFNDMITLKKMAETGRLGKNRTEITKINGQLFNLRMNVNLVSNVLDTPEIFWSEPALQPMYNAIREYLEVPQRAQILNDRLKVISDLLSMLRDHLTNFGVEYQTLIIIYLIIIAVIVACFEIAVKILQSIEII
ncbi:hypothetical protein BDB01DRAFT_720370 [Pilobolus umbonatus]|nr:hypothetical protein BDB01DRAFT_720370 [Pilobolus umbonatus]